MKKDQTYSQKVKKTYNAKLPNDPEIRINRLMDRIGLALLRLEQAVKDNKKEIAYKNKRLIADMEKEVLEWKRLKK